MPELDALLLRNHRITSFQSYLEKLTAEEISGLVPKVEPLSLQKAAQAWDQLRADLLAVAEAHRQRWRGSQRKNNGGGQRQKPP